MYISLGEKSESQNESIPHQTKQPPTPRKHLYNMLDSIPNDKYTLSMFTEVDVKMPHSAVESGDYTRTIVHPIALHNSLRQEYLA